VSKAVEILVRHQNRVSWLLFFGTLAVFFFTANRSTVFFANDTIYVAQPAWTLGFGGSLNIDQFSESTVANWTILFDGHKRSDRFPGAILFTVPFYAVAHSNVFSVVPSALAAAVACSAAVVILHRLLLNLVSARTALAASLLFAFATSIWTVASDAIWSEGPTILALALATWALTKQSWVLAGLGYAFAILSRPHTAVFAAVAGLWEGITRRSWAPILKIGAVSVLGFVGLLIWNKLNSGQWDIFPGSYGRRIESATLVTSGGQAQGSEWGKDYLATFFSPLRGLFVYSPFLLLLLPGLVRAWRVAPPWVRSTAVGGVAYLVVQLAGNSWLGGQGFFGYRLILPSLFAWWPLLTLAWQQWTVKASWSRYAFYGLAAISMWWFAQGSLVFRLDDVNADSVFYTTWSSWQAGRIIGFAGPFGWVAAAVFVGALAFLVSLVPAEDPSVESVKKRKGKKPVAKKPATEDTNQPAEKVALGATSRSEGSGKKKPAPSANKKRR